jgi:hypothetical protein
MINVLAALASIAVVASLSGALYGWFKVSLHRFDIVAAKDVLTSWNAELEELSEGERELRRTQPPVEVLEAILALPGPRLRRFQMSYTR